MTAPLEESNSKIQEKARLYEAEQQRTTYLVTLHRLGIELATLHEKRSVLDTLAMRAATQLGAYDCIVVLVSPAEAHGILSAQFGLPIAPSLDKPVDLESPSLLNALTTGEPFFTSDIRRDLPELQSIFRAEAQAVHIYPMMWQAKVTGFIGLSSLSVRMPSPEEITAFQLLSERAAAALENARLFEETHRLAEQLAVVHEIGQEIARLTDIQAILEVAVRRTVEKLGYYNSGIFLEKNGQLVFEVGYTSYGHQPLVGYAIPGGKGITDHVLRTGEAYLARDVLNDPYYLPYKELPDTRSELAVPILSSDRVLGIIDIQSQYINHLDDFDRQVLEAIAGHCATALENAHLFAETHHRADELHARNLELARLYRASGSLIASVTLDTQSMAQAIVEAIQQEFGQSICSLLLIQEGIQDLLRLIVAGPHADQLIRRKLTLQGPGLLPKAIHTGQVINVPDVSTSPDYVGNWPAARSELAVPLKIGSEILGAIDLQSDVLNAFTASDEQLMTIFAERAALALSNARLYEQTMRSLRRLTAFRTIDEAINSSMDLRVTLNILLEQVTSQLGVDAAAILLYNADSQILEYAAVRGFRSRKIERMRLHMNEGNAGRVAFERRPIQMLALPELADAVARFQYYVGEQFIAYFGLPLIAKGQLRGVLEILHRSTITPDQDWLDFLETLARQAAIALDNVALFENLQRSNSELTLAYDEAIEGWSEALELRYTFQKGHAQRAADMTVRLGRAMRVAEADLVHARRGALLHDIGEIIIPENVLQKAGALTEEEWNLVRQHPVSAFELLSPIRFLQPAADIPHCHHERWDGKGYPSGLIGEQIPLLARIFAVADTWDALRSPRPHRPAWSKEDARNYIRGQAGKCFDPLIVETFLTLPDL
jgi:HD-GYP domain-containing protein (c-di-GMP phosphodiesterase class II)/putative methionine-R-sulfoxide reductase with GAF domain